MEAWQSLLPAPVVINILEQLVLPKLTRAVENWNPRTDTVAIHVWLHPWLPFLGSRMQTFYPSIKHRLAVVLQQWNPQDTSAYAIIAPWKGVFDKGTMDSLLNQSILPKLAGALQDQFSFQFSEPFNWVMAWEALIPLHVMVHLLETAFFPKWHQVLYVWLSMEHPNYEEVMKWYLAWKQKFPPALGKSISLTFIFIYLFSFVGLGFYQNI